MVETHKKRKNTVITKITLTISNGEHVKHFCTARTGNERGKYYAFNYFIVTVS